MRIINTANVPIYCWAENIEDEAIEQVMDVANHPQAFHHVSLMPDAFWHGKNL